MKSRLLLFAVGGLLSAGICLACQVPVFRFALERWTPDAYPVTVTPGSSGALTGEEQAALDFLKARQATATGEAGVFANLAVEVAAEPAAGAPGARMAIGYPPKMRGFAAKPIWEGGLTLEVAKQLVDSPARREIVQRILRGESAVWVLVESGQADADRAAAETVSAALAEARGSLKVPDGVMTRQEAESSENFAAVNADDVLRSEVPLKIDFSLVRVRRDDPAEAMFLPMLLSIEDDLGDYAAEPMVFPVFGRGRLLEPLIGRGIRPENILEYATYICGACSCEVKDQNPGVDLLVSADWDTALHGSEVVIEKVLPPLEGPGVFSSAAAPSAAGPAPGSPAPAAAPPGEAGAGLAIVSTSPVTRAFPKTPILITAGLLTVVVVLGTLKLALRRRSS